MIKMNKNKNRNSQQRARYNHSDADQRSKNQAQYSRYLALGKEALAQGDKIEAERNFQYAEHYVRLLEKTPNRNNPPVESASNNETLKSVDETFPISIPADPEEKAEEHAADKNELRKAPSKKRAHSKPAKKNEPTSEPSNDLEISENQEAPAPVKKRRRKTTPTASETEA